MSKEEPRWTYEDFKEKICTLESKVVALEIAITNLELDCAQYRMALTAVSDMTDRIKSALNGTFEWSKTNQKIWNRKYERDARKPNPV